MGFVVAVLFAASMLAFRCRSGPGGGPGTTGGAKAANHYVS